MKYYYDLHMHSCLSPCGDMDMTPNNIVGMSKLLKLDFDGLKKEFYISLKKGVTPKSCVGGEIELYEEKRDFNTYKIIYTSEKITITI